MDAPDELRDAVIAAVRHVATYAWPTRKHTGESWDDMVPRDGTPAFIHATLHGLLYPKATS